MKTFNNILILFFGSLLISCGNQTVDNSVIDSSYKDTIKATTIDSFYMDEAEINSNEWKEYESDSSINNSPMQTELDNALKNELIDNYYKEIYKKGKLITTDDYKMESIPDSLFSNNPETDLFYFIVFTKSMNGSDGYYSEALGLSAFDFVTQKTEWFANYFNIAPRLTENDLDNWVGSVYGEIQISRENKEAKAISELENQLLENIKGRRKEYEAVIKLFIEKIKSAHNTG